MNQIELHKKIDELLTKSPAETESKDVSVLISANPDARQYFYTKADERWLDWIWVNGFLGVIKQKAEDPTRYGYRTPEVNYLVIVAEKVPAKVVDIMLQVPISKENFNPEVVDRFMRICSMLPAAELKRMVHKIRSDGWVPLMAAFNDWGFEYEKMLQTLTQVKDFDSVLILAEAVLSLRTKEEAKQDRGFLTDNPFCFRELGYTKVFEYLLKVDAENTERALALATDIMKRVVLFGEKEGKDEVFKVYDSFFLLDVDFFDLKLSERNRLSHRDDVKNLAAVITELARRTIGSYDTDPWRAQELYKKHFEPLPDSRSMWRLKLFMFALYPEYFKDELKNAFFRLFSVERYYNEIISGTEYMKALRAGFSVLSETDRRDYVKQVIDYFVKKDREKENEKENWHIGYGSRILSVITDYLTDEEKKAAESAGFTLKPDYEPEPSIGQMRGGTIVPRGPITKEEFGKLSIVDIAQKLRNEWTPEKLGKQNKSDDFLNPLNAEGAGELLRSDIPNRLQEYINSAKLFFERDVLDQHYTYSFLRGIQEVIRGKKTDINNINWDNLIILCVTIKQSGETNPFANKRREREAFDAWLSDWTGVHSAMTDVLQELLSEEGSSSRINFSQHRNELFGVISYLLKHPDPQPADEEPKTAVMTTTFPGEKEQVVSDPYSIAINTVRGRAFQAFALFVYQDGKKFPKEEVIKISSDVTGLYEAVLKNEKTRALMFMFGHYLPSFYFRDREWIRGLLSQIFPTGEENKRLYTAAWEGYVSANLYEEIFFDPDIQKLYRRSLALTDADFPKQKHFKDPDEGVAVHLALAFIHFSKFGFDHELFKKFWGTSNVENHKDFISFIGRHTISRESAVEWVKHNKVDLEKLKKFWDWALENCNADMLIGFGFWINEGRSPLETKWVAEHASKTLEKTKGYVEWEYGLMRSLVAFAKEAPEHAIAILRAHLLEEVAKHEPVRTWLHMNAEVYDAFRELYKNKTTQEAVRSLINDLLPYRNGMFWELKTILEDNPS